MNIPEFVEYAIESTKQYLEYVRNDENAGVKVIYVSQLVQKKGDPLTFYLRLDERLYNPENIEIAYETAQGSFEFVPQSQYSIVSYNDEKKVLTVRAKSQTTIFFSTPHPRFHIRIDMAFLIERFLKWYKSEDASYISCPSETPFVDRDHFFMLDRLSLEQRQAVYTALSAPLSYIWGPPGTGKTSAVLSSCLLNYVSEKKPVLVLAPTNNAVDQSLRGILKVLEETGHPRSSVLRIGIPGRSFLEQYPDVCESNKESYAYDKTKELEERLKEITELTDLRKEQEEDFAKLSEAETLYKNIFDDYEKQFALLSSTEQPLKEISQTIHSIKADHARISSADLSYREELRRLQENMQSVSFKAKAFFKSEVRKNALTKEAQLQGMISQTEKQMLDLKLQLQEAEGKQKTLEETKEKHCRKIAELQTSMNEVFEQLPEKYTEPTKFDQAQEQSEESNRFEWNTPEMRRLFALRHHSATVKANLEELPTYEELEKEEERAKQLIENLASYQLSGNRKDVCIYACTTDTFVRRIHDFVHRLRTPEENKQKEPLYKDIMHIFVDEAAYCPMPKCGPIFAAGVPVTLLGDHMQLPPICNASKDDILRHHHDLCLWDTSSLYFSEIFDDGFTQDDLFQEYQDGDEPSFYAMERAFLNKTYRFGENLASVLSEFVYPANFTGIENETAILLLEASQSKALPAPKEKRQNAYEVQAIKEYIQKYQPKDFAILTPYKNQVKLLIQNLPAYKENTLTIHASQGREWQTVILSVVDTGNKYFTDSESAKSGGKQIINTAISRAKEEIILCCEPDYWLPHENQLIGKLAAKAKPITL